jgi:hypothetical protein
VTTRHICCSYALLLLLLLLLRTSCCTKCALCTTLLGSDATLRPMNSICKNKLMRSDSAQQLEHWVFVLIVGGRDRL